MAWRLYRAGYFNARLFWPFALGSIPLAFVGGLLTLTGNLYHYVVGVALVLAAMRLLVEARDQPARSMPPPMLAVAVGAVLGFVSGLTGVGSGIFPSPLLLFLRWADMRHTAALSAVFILLNSLAGLAGHLAAGASVPAGLRVDGAGGARRQDGGARGFAVRRLAPVGLRAATRRGADRRRRKMFPGRPSRRLPRPRGDSLPTRGRAGLPRR